MFSVSVFAYSVANSVKILSACLMAVLRVSDSCLIAAADFDVSLAAVRDSRAVLTDSRNSADEPAWLQFVFALLKAVDTAVL